MRHKVAHRKLGRVTEHRIALLRNQATALIRHERIETTVPKAKELKPFVERLITIAKRGLAAGEGNIKALNARRLVLVDIQDRAVVGKLFDDIAPRFASRPGEFVITATGIEGSLVYAASAMLRDEIGREGGATLHLDLLPQLTHERVLAEVKHPRGSRSLSSHLKSRLNLGPLKMGLLHELLTREQMLDAATLATALKRLPLQLHAPRPVAEAISTAGGVRFEALTDGLMLKALPGVFVAGEMLDWEAPTGGYLLTASFASGRAAAQGLARWLSTPG